MEELMIKIKKYMGDLDNRKLINKLLLILVVSVLLLIIINSFSRPSKDKNQSLIHVDKTDYKKEDILDYSNFLESKLINILGKLKGVGNVDVMVTLEDSNEKIPAANTTKSSETTDETDSEGGKRKLIREEENTQLLQLGDDIIVLKEIKANVKGVIVVAKGAEDGEVLERIYEAVKTVLGINGNRVQVFPRN